MSLALLLLFVLIFLCFLTHLLIFIELSLNQRDSRGGPGAEGPLCCQSSAPPAPGDRVGGPAVSKDWRCTPTHADPCSPSQMPTETPTQEAEASALCDGSATGTPAPWGRSVGTSEPRKEKLILGFLIKMSFVSQWSLNIIP